mmetsp:Transcript_12301/g.31795  ORF Transcript_12301/g.31795 Transcript_12301/m.31795 type:complete len:120 (-) Transcript_12301:91-450(-)
MARRRVASARRTANLVSQGASAATPANVASLKLSCKAISPLTTKSCVIDVDADVGAIEVVVLSAVDVVAAVGVSIVVFKAVAVDDMDVLVEVAVVEVRVEVAVVEVVVVSANGKVGSLT